MNEFAAYDNDPLVQFENWYDLATKNNERWWAGLLRPVVGLFAPSLERVHNNSVFLATSSKEGEPSGRVVLLKKYSQKGFEFFTNYESSKAKDLLENPKASLTFYWGFPARQVRIFGEVVKMSEAESDAYWNSRPRDSQLSGMASPQSEQINSINELNKKISELKIKFKDKSIPRPSNWGGYLVTPVKYEFWEGKANRLHRRVKYSKVNNNWKKALLAP